MPQQAVAARVGSAGIHKHPQAEVRALRLIALFEALKGLAALAGGIGLLSLLHHDIRHLALELIGHFGLDPSRHLSTVFLHYADVLNATPTSAVLALAIGYTTIRLAEAYGLWNDHAWGEWLGALSGAIYIPFEVEHLAHRPGFINAGVLLMNMCIVIFLAWQLWRRRAAAAAAKAQGDA